MTGLAHAFASFGAVPRNVRWSWSARTPDGATVVLALWSDRFRWTARPVTYDGSELPDMREWASRQPGNRERLENLVWAQDHCDGRFRVVVVKPKHPDTVPRVLADALPRPGWVMTLTSLDRATGEFQAVLLA